MARTEKKLFDAVCATCERKINPNPQDIFQKDAWGIAFENWKGERKLICIECRGCMA